MFAVGDIVRDGRVIAGRVTHVFTEILGDEAEQVITIQPIGTADEALQVKRLASELTCCSAHLTQESDKCWGLA